MTITSPHNDRLRELRKLARRRARDVAGRFVAEGEDLLDAADAAGWTPVERYCAAGSGLPGVEVEAEVLASVSQLGSGTRTLGVYETRWAPTPSGPVCVYLHGIADPGNVGTILRSALAFGAASVVLGPDCADPYGPKAVRASMGAIFTVPVARATGLDELPGETIALDAHADEVLGGPSGSAAGDAPTGREAPGDAAPRPVTLLVGAERAGLPEELLRGADRTVRIPIHSESLNAAMAATVALYELTRGQIAPRSTAPDPANRRMGAA